MREKLHSFKEAPQVGFVLSSCQNQEVREGKTAHDNPNYLHDMSCVRQFPNRLISAIHLANDVPFNHCLPQISGLWPLVDASVLDRDLQPVVINL